MGIHTWKRTGARMTVAAHAVKLINARPDSLARSTVTIDWPVTLWLYAWVAEIPNSRGWHWIIRNHMGRKLEEGTSTKEAGARSAVRRHVVKLLERTRHHPDVAALEAAKVKPLLAQGYRYSDETPQVQRGVALQRDGSYAEVAVSTQEQAAEVLRDGLAGLAALKAGAAKAGVKL